MIEILVSTVVFSILMGILINAFGSASKITIRGERSIEIFERSQVALDFITEELKQMTVNVAQPLTYKEDQSLSFYASLPFSENNAFLSQKITYSYTPGSGSALGSISRQIGSDKAIILLKDVESFKLRLLSNYDTLSSTPLTTHDLQSDAKFALLSLTLGNPAKGAEALQQSFSRLVLLQN